MVWRCRAHVQGTGIPVFVILENLAEGVSSDEIRDNDPSLTEEDIRDSISYPANLL